MSRSTLPEFNSEKVAAARHRAALDQARAAGLLGGSRNARIAGRVPAKLVAAAKKRAGTKSDTDVIEIALAALAIEDDFGARLVRRKGSIPKGIKLGI